MNCNNRNYRNQFGSLGFFQDFFNEVFDAVETAEKTIEKTPSLIRANVSEADDKFFLSLELPGISKSDIKLDIEGRLLTITVDKAKDEDSVDYMRREFNYAKASRKFKLSNAVDTSDITAEMKEGILIVTLAKKPAFVPKDIKIK